MTQIVAGRYAVLGQPERLGGHSKVVKARDIQDGVLVALKLIPRSGADTVQRLFFSREVQALIRLKHTNIVSLLDYGEDDGADAFFLVLEWMERRLDDALPPFDERGWDDFAQDFGLPILDGLAHAHGLGIVHRDVKPSNILISDDGTLRLADFGISKIKDRIAPTEATVADFFSRPYAPPDAEGMSNASRDVFGFGVTVLRCLTTGKLDDYTDIPAALDDIDVAPAIRAVLEDCVNRDDPDARPQNAIILRERLRALQRERQKKWIEPSLAAITVRDDPARRLVEAPLHRDPEAVEAALESELGHGTHLRRLMDGATGKPSPDTLELTGASQLMRLVVLPDDPRFVLSKVNERDDAVLDKIRSDSWPVDDDVRWTSRALPDATARASMDLVLARFHEYENQRDDERHFRAENRRFAQWLSLLDAKVELERSRLRPMPYTQVKITKTKAVFELIDPPDVSVLEEALVCETPGGGIAGLSGTVIDQDGNRLTLRFARVPKALPPRGQLVLDIGPSKISIRRQREAVGAVMAGDTVHPRLREMVLDPATVTPATSAPAPLWINPDLDEDKKSAITMALNSPDFFLLNGPPGTGKTGFIAELIQQELIRKPDSRILLVSQTHVAVDNALVRLANAGAENLVRLGRADSVDPKARKHLLDEKMPVWAAKIRKQAEEHLLQRAKDASVDPAHVEAAAHLSALITVLQESARVQAWLVRTEEALAGGSAPPAAEFGTEETTSEAARLNSRLQELAERAEELRNRANTALGEDLALPEQMSEQEAQAAFDAVVADDERMKQLVGLLKLQADWFQRIEASDELEGVLLRQSKVVAGTCLGFLGHPAARDLEFDLCILDEASKATATETLVPLARAHRWVLVGDPHQLPPMQEEVLDHEGLTEKYSLERADVELTLFQWLLDNVPAGARSKLTQQYRMHPGIGDLVAACFYRGELTSAANPSLPGWDRLHKPVHWLDTSDDKQRRETRVGTSAINRHEIKVIRRVLDSLRRGLENGFVRPDEPPLKVLVLTAYLKQMEELRRSIATTGSSHLRIEVNTVDAVQGREADVTIYSVVRSNDSGNLGFLGPLHWRRVNVALSRSRFGLVIVGDANFCEQAQGPLGDVLAYMKKHPESCSIGKAPNG